MVFALGASDLTPPLGESVELVATVADAGSAPATVRWSGVDRAEGARAWVTPAAAGPHRVCADERCVELDVGGRSPCFDGARAVAGRCGAVPVAGTVVPHVEVDACFDDAWPRIVAGSLLVCTRAGQVDAAVDPATMERWPLPAAARTPRVAGWWVLLGDGPTWVDVRSRYSAPAEVPRRPGETLGARAGSWILAAADGLRTADDAWAARPLPDAPPVEAGGLIVWTERTCGPAGCDDDVWARAAGQTFPFAAGPGDQRRPVAAGARLAWFDGGDVVVQDLERGERRRWVADAGFRGPLALDESRACWEDRAALRAGTGRVTLRCTDGLEVRAAEDVLSPSLGGGWLAWHQGDQVYVVGP